ncbi:hypothetical protein FGO68_gene15729 [Halteria grandinella]|uniref:Uncharacterized protein n=1 Tax=Halteria grandinella TaxID=5974 RepID=A0A8J8TA10_HALGN|nr:hypothetical protein FGO68_gene15729 [Halteria grandinella]
MTLSAILQCPNSICNLSQFLTSLSESACYTKPVTGGLFHLQLSDPLYQVQTSYKSGVSIQNCEFVNFFYEMNSLIGFPINSLDFDPSNFTISITDSKFARFSSCGSLLSNFHLPDLVREQLSYRGWLVYPRYIGYAREWQKAANVYMNKRYLLHKPTTYMDAAYFERTQEYNYIYYIPYTMSPFERYNTGQFDSKVELRNNTISEFNYLKAIHHEGDNRRRPWGMDVVGHVGLRNQGLILSFYGNFNQSLLSIENNTFINTYQAYEVFNSSSIKSGYQIQNIFGSLRNQDPYLQINHMISVMNVTATLVIMNDNVFRNISISGPLINLAEQPGYFTTAFIIANNNFSTIQALVNSNILQITRSKIDYEYPLVAYPNVDMQPWYQTFNLDHQQLGGSIVIIGNTFNDICGGENVDASVMLIGVRHDLVDDYTNKRGHFPVMDKQYFTKEFLYDTYYKYADYYFKDVSIVHPQIGEIHLVRMGVNISSNTYSNICMGPEVYEKIIYQNILENKIFNKFIKARGSLASFIFISQVHIYNETFIDIGAYSQNYSDQLQMKIKNINSLQPRFMWPDNDKFDDLLIPDYLKHNLSTSLLVVQYGQEIIMGGCLFDNIWLIDRINALSRSQAQGLILFVEIFNGEVTLGQPGKAMILQNLNGFLNDRNLGKIRSEYNLTQTQDDKFTQYGVGSILFNLHNSSNSYNMILMQNVEIRDSYFCASKLKNYNGLVRTSAILSTNLGDEFYSNVPFNITIVDMIITNVNFGGISNYFEIYGQIYNISKINISNIGFKNFQASNQFIIDFIGSDLVQRDLKLTSSFFKVLLFSREASGQAPIEIENLTVRNINPTSGAFPIFIIAKPYNEQYDYETAINMRDIEFKDSLVVDSSVEEVFLPKGSLFKVETSGFVNLQVSIFNLSMTSVYSQCKFFIDSHTIQMDYSKLQETQTRQLFTNLSL